MDEIFCDELLKEKPHSYKIAVEICREWRKNNNPLCADCIQYGVLCEMSEEERKKYYDKFN